MPPPAPLPCWIVNPFNVTGRPFTTKTESRLLPSTTTLLVVGYPGCVAPSITIRTSTDGKAGPNTPTRPMYPATAPPPRLSPPPPQERWPKKQHEGGGTQLAAHKTDDPRGLPGFPAPFRAPPRRFQRSFREQRLCSVPRSSNAP